MLIETLNKEEYFKSNDTRLMQGHKMMTKLVIQKLENSYNYGRYFSEREQQTCTFLMWT